MKFKLISIESFIKVVFILVFILFLYLIFSDKEKIEVKVEVLPPAIKKQEAIESRNLNLKEVLFSDLNGFNDDNLIEAYPALIRSCVKIMASPLDRVVKKVYHEQACKAILNLEDRTSDGLRDVIVKYFSPFLVLNSDNQSSDGTFTGYYSAELNGSYKKDEKYKYPLYKIPSDAVTLNASDFLNCKRCNYIGRVKNGKLVPYYTREDIENGLINENDVLFWVDNPVDSFILHIQGSGVVVLPDGEKIKINYAGNNGHNFVGIGWVMKMLNLLEKGKGSMPDVKDWLNKDLKKAHELMLYNPRYIFFKEAVNNEGPIGSLGVELTPKRSLAIDNNYIPLGLMVWLDTKDPDGNDIKKLVSAQDTGAAIKGRVRGDFYFGHGAEAFKDAGRMKSKGSYYLLLPQEKLF